MIFNTASVCVQCKIQQSTRIVLASPKESAVEPDQCNLLHAVRGIGVLALHVPTIISVILLYRTCSSHVAMHDQMHVMIFVLNDIYKGYARKLARYIVPSE